MGLIQKARLICGAFGGKVHIDEKAQLVHEPRSVGDEGQKGLGIPGIYILKVYVQTPVALALHFLRQRQQHLALKLGVLKKPGGPLRAEIALLGYGREQQNRHNAVFLCQRQKLGVIRRYKLALVCKAVAKDGEGA